VNDNAALSNALAAKFGAIGSITGGNSNWVYNVGETLHFILRTNYSDLVTEPITNVSHLAFLLNGPGVKQWGTNLPPTTLLDTRQIATNGTPLSAFPDNVGYLQNIVEDTTPQLGGSLDGQNYSLSAISNIVGIGTGYITNFAGIYASFFYGDGSGLDNVDAATLDGEDGTHYLDGANMTNVFRYYITPRTLVLPHDIEAVTNQIPVVGIDNITMPYGATHEATWVTCMSSQDTSIVVHEYTWDTMTRIDTVCTVMVAGVQAVVVTDHTFETNSALVYEISSDVLPLVWPQSRLKYRVQ